MVLFEKQEGWGRLTGLGPACLLLGPKLKPGPFRLFLLCSPHRVAKPLSRNTTSPTGSTFPENYLSFKV